MRKVFAATAMAGALAGGWTPAWADISEIRVGVLAHNIRVTDPKNANKEDGVNLNAEVLFESPVLFGRIGAPKPYLMASANTAGETSYAGAGVIWQWRFADGWRLEPGLGYVIHSGEELDNPIPPNQPARRQAFENANLLLGSRDLFRTSIAVTRELSQRWAVQATFEHLSHGQILGSGRNQGLDTAGVRVVYRFAE